MKTTVTFSDGSNLVRFDRIAHRQFFRYDGKVYWKIRAPSPGVTTTTYRGVCLEDAQARYFMDSEYVAPIEGNFTATIAQRS